MFAYGFSGRGIHAIWHQIWKTGRLAQKPNFESIFDSSKPVWFQNLETEQTNELQTSETKQKYRSLKI